MKTKLQAGLTIDTLTQDELRAELHAFAHSAMKSWREELSRGVKYRRRAYTGTVAADGTLTIIGDGPAEGMIWSLTRLTFAAGTPGATGVNLHANEVAGGSMLWRGLVDNEEPSDTGVVLVGGDVLVIAGSGLTVAEQIIITVSIKEVPAMLGWSA